MTEVTYHSDIGEIIEAACPAFKEIPRYLKENVVQHLYRCVEEDIRRTKNRRELVDHIVASLEQFDRKKKFF